MAEPIVCQGTGEQPGDLVSDVEKCHICLSPRDRDVASLDSCSHVFCLQCIFQWAQVANTCPVDRTSFTFIYQRQSPGGDIQKKIRVTAKKNDDNEEESNNPVICEECGRSDRTHHLLVCLHCDSGYHMNCLTPALRTAPEGDWICPDCGIITQPTGDLALEEEISEGELTDLLAEVDETATTSSRLRLSTVSRPSSLAARRHSSRIQSRARRSLSPSQPSTHWHVPKYLIQASKPTVASEACRQSNSPKRTRRKRRKRSARGIHKKLTRIEADHHLRVQWTFIPDLNGYRAF